MAATDPIAETDLTVADLDAVQMLVDDAGWNQNHADWRIFFDFGRVLGARGPDGAPVATAAILPYPGGFGWISMVLVAEAWRRRGIATRLLTRCMELLREQNRVPILDATPFGQDVYRKLGFRDTWAFTRWRRPAEAHPTPRIDTVRPIEDRDWPAVVALDAAVFGSERPHVLDRLRQRSQDFACIAETDGQLRGFVLGRDGRTATQLGPLIAEDGRTATAIVESACQRIEESIMIDALDQHQEFAHKLEQLGFTRQRPFSRMIFGSHESFGDPGRTIAIAGPELG